MQAKGRVKKIDIEWEIKRNGEQPRVESRERGGKTQPTSLSAQK